MTFSWEMLYSLGAFVLLAALIYGMWQYKTRNRANDRTSDEATRQMYAKPSGMPDSQTRR